MAEIQFRNVTFSREDKMIFDNLSFELSDYDSYSIIGPNAFGKTSLLKLMTGELSFSGTIMINRVKVVPENPMVLNRNIAIVFDDDFFVRETLREEFKFSLESLNIAPKDITSQINYLINYFSLEELIDTPICKLSKRNKTIAHILAFLIVNPRILVLDDLFGWLDKNFKEKLIIFLKNHGITLVNVISDSNDSLYTDYLLVFMKNGRIAMEGPTLAVLKEEKLMHRLGMKIPFMVDLSIQLGYYELLDTILLNKEEMVSQIWK